MRQRITIITACVLLTALNLFGQMSRTNYVKTTVMLDSVANGKNITIQYYDDYGRPRLKASPSTGNSYIFSDTDYDICGREYRHWLPFPQSVQPYISSYNDYIDAAQDFYQDADPNTERTYDALHRVATERRAGEEWHANNDGIRYTYRVNGNNSVKRYDAPLSAITLTKEGYYPAGTLASVLVTDEDGHTTETFTDELGRTVLERRDGNSDTYFVYNPLGLLRYVLSPQYQQKGNKAFYGYEYRYDSRRRVVKKILPGCKTIQYWYDKGDRLMFMRDERLTAARRYRFYFYDHLGRLCVQGTCSDCNRGNYHGFVNHSISVGGLCDTGYELEKNGAVTNPELEVCYYYDDYEFLNTASFNTVGSLLSAVGSHQNAHGLQTGSIIVASNGERIYTATYYDYEGRPADVRTVGLGNIYSRKTTAYTFTGKPLEVNTATTVNGTVFSVKAASTYTGNTDLPSTTSLSFGGGTEHRIAFMSYDGINRLRQNQRSGSAGTVSYTYNVNSWLTSITSPQFTEHLYYEDGPHTGCYNGNISSLQWTTANESITRGYKFSYDGQDRMTAGVYGEGSDIGSNANRYTERVAQYNKNGSPTALERYGKLDNGTFGKIDDLTLMYKGNRLLQVADAAPGLHYNGAFDFRDGANMQQEYTYDGCGSLTSDANKGIAWIDYDLTGMPRRIQFTNGNVTEYVYSVSGEKLRTIHRTAMPDISVPIGSTLELTAATTLNVDSTDYIGSMQLKNGQLDRYLFPGGFCTYPQNVTAASQPVFHYYTQDHLGNNRTVVNENGTLEQVTHYYPFGGIFGDATLNAGTQPYKYNGKEFDHTHGLDWYDYGARMYDPILLTWNAIDPLAEKYYNISPYAYCTNNPISYFDPDGKRVQIYQKNQKQVLGYINKLAQGTFAIDKKGYLYLAKSSNSKGFSKTYTESLVKAINNKDKTIIIYVDDHYYDNKGNKQDISQKGEGTTKEFYNGMIVVVISGKSYNGLVDKNGISISDEPEYILAHEIAGHAEPRLNNIGNGEVVNAVEIENIIRRETNKKERKEDPSHVQ